jgi:Uma2 family endonuclease
MNVRFNPDSDDAKPVLLENGDHLSRAEFERRYDASPDIKKAELLRGVVYVASPVRMKLHGEPHFRLGGWVAHYQFLTPGTRGGDNATVRLDDDNVPQPDVLLCIDPKHSGNAKVVDEYVEGAPELVAEVASSSVSLDLGIKLEVYRDAGVQEYLVWRVLDDAVDWFRLRDGQFVPLTTNDGILRSEVFPGLWLDAASLVAGDMRRVLAVLDQGIATPEHGRFLPNR